MTTIDPEFLKRCQLEMPSPGMEPPRPMGDFSTVPFDVYQRDIDVVLARAEKAEACCAQAEAEVDRLKAALDLEAKARVAAAEMAHTAKLAQSKAEGDATAMLMLLAQIREAVGDNGRRMHGELVDYLRILFEEADPDRVRQREAAERLANDYATPHDPSDAGAWGEDRFEAAS